MKKYMVIFGLMFCLFATGIPVCAKISPGYHEGYDPSDDKDKNGFIDEDEKNGSKDKNKKKKNGNGADGVNGRSGAEGNLSPKTYDEDYLSAILMIAFAACGMAVFSYGKVKKNS